MLVLDDFGTGYSSLSYLSRFPIDALKIDRSFVADISQPGQDTAIIEAIVRMAGGLRVDLIAEGVETGAQAASLRQIGCNLAQGYYYARPHPTQKIAPLISSTLPSSVAVA